MSQEELRRVEVLARVLSGRLRVVDSSRLLGVSPHPISGKSLLLAKGEESSDVVLMSSLR